MVTPRRIPGSGGRPRIPVSGEIPLNDWAVALVSADRSGDGGEPVVKLVSAALRRLADDRRLQMEDREFAKAQLTAIRRAVCRWKKSS